MLAQRCACGFARLEDEEVIDHLMAVFVPDDATGPDGQVHEEIAGQACTCGFRAAHDGEIESHFIAVFAPADRVASDGCSHEVVA